MFVPVPTPEEMALRDAGAVASGIAEETLMESAARAAMDCLRAQAGNSSPFGTPGDELCPGTAHGALPRTLSGAKLPVCVRAARTCRPPGRIWPSPLLQGGGAFFQVLQLAVRWLQFAFLYAIIFSV